jgi:hypothetical protein
MVVDAVETRFLFPLKFHFGGLNVDIRKIAVSCEKLLAKLEKEFPNLTKVGYGAGASITGAGAGFTMAQVAAAAKKHDANADKHTVHKS